MKEFIKKYSAWLIVVLCLIGFSVIVINIKNNNIDAFDNHIYNIIATNKNDALTSFYKVITNFGESKIILVLLVLLLIFIKNKKQGILFSLASIGSFGITFVIKHLAKRARPVGIALINETGYSFPSSHSMIVIAFYGFLLYLLLKSNLKKYIKVILSILLLLIIIIVPISRIYLGVHHASDVVAGLLLSIAFTIAYIKLIYNKMSSN